MTELKTPHANPEEQRQPVTADDQSFVLKPRRCSNLCHRIRPHQLPERFPRIMNQIALLWRRPVQLDRYFEELLIDRRGDRQGFRFAVVLELNTLKDYHQSEVYPKKDCVWQKG